MSWFRKKTTPDYLKEMREYRDRAEFAAISFLEPHAVGGTLTRQMIEAVSDAINIDVGRLCHMIPDRRVWTRYVAAKAGMRKVGVDLRTQDESDD